MEVRRAEAVFEELPELKASEILKPELLKGPHFVVRDPVPTGSGMNQFTIDSDFGVFEADGNEMLLQRLKEIDAIARLQEGVAACGSSVIRRELPGVTRFLSDSFFQFLSRSLLQ
jgi:hypothetical protein